METKKLLIIGVLLALAYFYGGVFFAGVVSLFKVVFFDFFFVWFLVALAILLSVKGYKKV